MAALIQNVTEAIRANHRARVNVDAIPDLRTGVDDHVWEKSRPFANHTIGADMVAAPEDRIGPDSRPVADRAERPDVRAGVDAGARINHSRRMNTRSKARRRKEQPQ